ncbi:enoyl-CoA hydratase-related protein [Sinorhizobium fredii]|uniref:enoyl-CoA hydratase-related protein n=1 Tax=Rhizobium fredii TaxID=380 RepID=UPI0005956A1D|nr:enoyl-CoA hydratase-related protein [Sinorhizobium fredii]WOS65485.1 enoyl-CoA hydratase-related protein [Sinorhizobium fredii GR64]
MEPSEYKDILYEITNRVATITFNRPDRMNAFTRNTYYEVTDAIRRAGWDREVGVIVLTGADTRAFGIGGDKDEKKADRVDSGIGILGNGVEELQTVIRDVPKPVIAKVRGYAIGSGNVLVTICDLAIAAENAVFGQAGPRMGSVDPGFGTALLARIVGEKKAREIWYLCRRYPAREALAMGLINAVVPDDALDAEVDQWCAEINAKSPTAIALAKRSFNADSENIRGIGQLAFQALALYFGTEESKEGGNALREKREPDFVGKMYRGR